MLLLPITPPRDLHSLANRKTTGAKYAFLNLAPTLAPNGNQSVAKQDSKLNHGLG